jgi:hypothetical protein
LVLVLGKLLPELKGEKNAVGSDGHSRSSQRIGCPGIAGMKGVVRKFGSKKLALGNRSVGNGFKMAC